MLASQGESHDLDVSFELLRTDPSVLESLVSSGRDETRSKEE